jgi:hypothetical protein
VLRIRGESRVRRLETCVVRMCVLACAVMAVFCPTLAEAKLVHGSRNPASSSATPAVTAIATMTATATAIPTSTATATPTPAKSATPTPSITPTARPSATATPASLSINGVYDLPNYNTTIPSSITGNSAVDGIAIRTYWNEIEASEGVYNWSIIDKMIAQVTPPNINPGKKISISIYAGWGTPSWVFSAGAQSFSWVWDSGWGPAACSVVKTPLPWDPVFQSKWAAFLAAFGSKYDSNPYVTHVSFTGINSTDAEVWVPHKINESINVNGVTCKGYNDVADWQAAGYTRTRMEGALDWDAAQFASAFPDRPFTIETDPCSLPAIDDNGNFFSSPGNCGDQQGVTDFLNYGIDTYGRGHFIIQNDGLSSSPYTELSTFWNTMTADSTYVDIGFQFSYAVGTTNFDSITQNGVNMGSKVIEFYQSDLTNSGNAAEIVSAHNQLISK